MKPFSSWKRARKHKKITGKVVGPRKSRRAVLDLFKERFKNVSDLTIRRTHSQDAVELYVTKEETRLRGPCLYRRSIKNCYLFAYNNWNQNQRIAPFESLSTSNFS